MADPIDEGGQLAAESLSAQSTTNIEDTLREALTNHFTESSKDESDTVSDKVKQESISPPAKVVSTNPQEPRRSIWSGIFHHCGVPSSSNVKGALGPEGTNPIRSKSSSSEGKKATRRPSARTPKEYFARQFGSATKKHAIPNGNLPIAGRVTKTKDGRSKKKRPQSSKASLEKLKNKFKDADSFNLDLGKEAPTFQARTLKEQFDNLLADCPEEYHDIHKRGVSKTTLLRSSRGFGRGMIRAQDGKWKHKGMDSALLHHQLIGVYWMLSRELAKGGPHGGILADSMGLGKTVQCVATIVANPPDLDEIRREEGATLIIVPSSILAQWRQELKKHAGSTIRRIDIYKAKDNRDTIVYTSADVVLTTFAEVTKSVPWPDKETLIELKKMGRTTRKKRSRDAESSYVETFILNNYGKSGVLHQIKWYRVIVDEGHLAQNHLSKTSLALNALQSKYRWVLTGTPFMNRLEDFYSYFRFLKDPETTTLKRFSAQFCNFESKECNRQMDRKLATSMIRRTMEDRIMGRPLIVLPRAHYKAIGVEFNAAERILYDAVEEKFDELRDRSFADRDPRKAMSHPFAQITHLRQLASHPSLIERKIMILFNQAELEEIRDKIQALDHVLYQRMSSWIRGERAKVVAEYQLSEEEEHPKICELCHEEGQEGLTEIPGCKHLFCDFCLNVDEAIELSEEGREVHKCPACAEPYDPSELEKAQEKRENNIEQMAKKKGMKGKDFRKYIPTTQKSVWLDQYDRGVIELRPGSKLEAVMDQVREWLEEAPGEKIIIYTQWKMVSTIIGRMLEKEKIDFLYFSGDMSQKTRAKAVEMFGNNPKIKVLVSGLKCGGLGLNLTFANKVVSVELWWNPWAEKQAFGRVHRIGQVLETIFARAVVTKCIEDRLAKLQLKKLRINSISMQDTLTKEEAAALLNGAEPEETLDLDAVDCNGDSIYALVGSDPTLDSDEDVSMEPSEESSDESHVTSPENEIMENIDEELDNIEGVGELDDNSSSDTSETESMQAIVETDEEDDD